MSFIQKASLNDVKDLNILINSAYRGEYSKKGWTTEADLLDGTRTDEKGLEEILTDPDSAIFKYVDDSGKIIGCVRIKKIGEKIYLGILTVAAELQSKGIGKQLVETVEQEAKNLHCSAVYMSVISVRKELIEWYERDGY